jgi:hypothetical protein
VLHYCCRACCIHFSHPPAGGGGCPAPAAATAWAPAQRSRACRWHISAAAVAACVAPVWPSPAAVPARMPPSAAAPAAVGSAHLCSHCCACRRCLLSRSRRRSWSLRARAGWRRRAAAYTPPPGCLRGAPGQSGARAQSGKGAAAILTRHVAASRMPLPLPARVHGLSRRGYRRNVCMRPQAHVGPPRPPPPPPALPPALALRKRLAPKTMPPAHPPEARPM